MKRLLPLLLLGLALALHGQQVMELNIEDALKLALENNVAFRISQQEVKFSRYRVVENSRFLPTVTLQGQKILKEKLMTIEIPPFFPGMEPIKGTLDFTRNYEFTFQIVQPVFTSGKVWLNFRNAQIDLNIAKEKERNSRADTILAVKKTFYSIQILQQLLEVQKEALALAQNNHQNVKQSFDLGMTSQYDLLRSELALSAVKPEILRVENLLETSLSSLKMMLGIGEGQTVVLKGELQFSPFQLEEAGVIQNALLNRSELLQLQMERRKVNNLLKITWAQFIPDLSIVANYSYRSDLFKFGANKWEDYYTIGLGVNFTIFSGLRRSAQVGEMAVAKKIIDLNLKQLSDATALETENKLRTIKQEYENIILGQKNMETAKEGVRIAELSYKEGLVTILELNSSYTELTRAKVNYLQALFNYNIAIAEVEKISGIKIDGGVK